MSATTTPVDLHASYSYCSGVARREARNFYYSFLLLPPGRRRSMCALYAFMRQTDDLADDPGDPATKRIELDLWRRELEAALVGEPVNSPVLPALADTVRRYGIPPRYLIDVIDGVSMDLEPHKFARFEELYGYCYRVASAVGLCCIHIWGFRSDGGRAEAMAESCGLALQLTNILRDLAEDAGLGRVYLPADELARFNIGPNDLAKPDPARLRPLLEFQAHRAYKYYEEGAPLVALVDPIGRPVLRTIVNIYRNLLDEIVRRDFDVFSGRVSLSGRRKAQIALSSIWGGRRVSGGSR